MSTISFFRPNMSDQYAYGAPISFCTKMSISNSNLNCNCIKNHVVFQYGSYIHFSFRNHFLFSFRKLHRNDGILVMRSIQHQFHEHTQKQVFYSMTTHFWTRFKYPISFQWKFKYNDLLTSPYHR